MMEIHPSSFRDPSGFVFERDGVLFRQVNERCRASYDELMTSGLYHELVQKQLLVPHVEVDVPPAAAGAWRILEPEIVPFISYPAEWSFGELKKAALATLRIQKIALRHGMTLRDSSAFNVQFVGPRPLFIDTLSFEHYVEGKPWVGYRQFCQHFLAPLYLVAGRDPRLSALSAGWMDGIPLEIARRLAPRRYRWRPGFLAHIALHAMAQQRYQEAVSRPVSLPKLPRASLERLLDSLRSTVEGLSWNPGSTPWVDYYSRTNYSEEAMALKRQFVSAVLDTVRPGRVVDLGANTGEFSLLAARPGAYVVSADADHGAVERCFRRVSQDGNAGILPLVVDLASPTPAVGWMNAERASFLDRCRDRTDLVLALALVHHLAIGNNVPLRGVVQLFARVGTSCVVEFVEKGDSQVRRLLASREDIFDDYSEAGFEKALSGVLQVVRKQRITGTQRVMYHLKRV